MYFLDQTMYWGSTSSRTRWMLIRQSERPETTMRKDHLNLEFTDYKEDRVSK